MSKSKKPDSTPESIPQMDSAKETPSTESREQVTSKPENRESEKGFFGVEVDQTPNENYTVSGVTKGLPTPETKAAAETETEAKKTKETK
ncbi:MAG TPA: hypothetical protein VK612_11405 [Pyrinomonadaceae bacterium]|nr:hypothetical protein [Pyrinomonadaceae bacterium]